MKSILNKKALLALILNIFAFNVFGVEFQQSENLREILKQIPGIVHSRPNSNTPNDVNGGQIVKIRIAKLTFDLAEEQLFQDVIATQHKDDVLCDGDCDVCEHEEYHEDYCDGDRLNCHWCMNPSGFGTWVENAIAQKYSIKRNQLIKNAANLIAFLGLLKVIHSNKDNLKTCASVLLNAPEYIKQFKKHGFESFKILNVL